jgi:hypothetical protein
LWEASGDPSYQSINSTSNKFPKKVSHPSGKNPKME